jgi:hypothetical protein
MSDPHPTGSFAPAPPRRGPGRTLLLALVLGFAGLVLALEADLGVILVYLAVTGFLVWMLLQGPHRLRYEVAGSHLVVRTALLTKRFALAGRTARRTAVRGRIRLAGTGMPGYHAGLFLLDVGMARVYASRFDDGVLLEGRPRIFVSPADPEALLAALRSRGVRG